MKPSILVVILWDWMENEYQIRGIDGKKVDPSLENNITTILEADLQEHEHPNHDCRQPFTYRTFRKLQKMGIRLINLKLKHGCFRIDTELVQNKLASLNNQLQRKCPALSLRFGKGH